MKNRENFAENKKNFHQIKTLNKYGNIQNAFGGNSSPGGGVGNKSPSPLRNKSLT